MICIYMRAGREMLISGNIEGFYRKGMISLNIGSFYMGVGRSCLLRFLLHGASLKTDMQRERYGHDKFDIWDVQVSRTNTRPGY